MSVKFVMSQYNHYVKPKLNFVKFPNNIDCAEVINNMKYEFYC